MKDFLASVKSHIKKSPLWPVLRPRRFHLYGIGAPRTGTLSLTRLFENYRVAHEPHLDHTVDLIQSDYSTELLRSRLRKRDRRWRLECEVGYHLVYVCRALVHEFPSAKFICTVRPPRRWVRSIIDRCINKPRAHLPDGDRFLRDYSFGEIPDRYPSQEKPLARHELRDLDGYLSYWAFHYQTILDAIPLERCLFMQTKDLSKADRRIADFVEIPVSDLCPEWSHTHKASKKHGVLDEIDSDYLEKKIEGHCQEVVNRLQLETKISLGE